VNRYESAIESMERARKARYALRELRAWLEDQERAAEAELAACESSPGIPLPQYRPGTHAEA
jgi:hypothetical protein